MCGFGLTLGRDIDPAHHVTVVVGLDRLERKRRRLAGQGTERYREVVELTGLDRAAAPSDLADDLGDLVSVVVFDRRRQCRLFDGVGPTLMWHHAHRRDRRIDGELHFDLVGRRFVLLVGHTKVEPHESTHRRFPGVDAHVSRGRACGAGDDQAHPCRARGDPLQKVHHFLPVTVTQQQSSGTRDRFPRAPMSMNVE